MSNTLLREDRLGVAVFIDNSNIWISGAKTFRAQNEAKPLLGMSDFRWRINFQNLTRLVAGDRSLAIPPRLYCSYGDKGSLSGMQKSFSKIGEVIAFRRSTWTNQEKMVDIAIVSNVHAALRGNGEIDTLVLVTGNADFVPLVVDLLDLYPGKKIEIWSWAASLSLEFSDLAAVHPDNLSIHILDVHIKTIGFTEMEWGKNTYVPPETAIVVDTLTDPILDTIMSAGPFRFKTLLSKEIVFIFNEFDHAQITSLIKCLQQISGSSSNVKSLVQWKGEEHDTPEPTPMVGQRCPYNAYCKDFKEGKCHLHHSRAARKHFAVNDNQPKKQWKTSDCKREACCYASDCPFVHPGEKTVCMTCEGQFQIPHKIGTCPWLKKTK